MDHLLLCNIVVETIQMPASALRNHFFSLGMHSLCASNKASGIPRAGLNHTPVQRPSSNLVWGVFRCALKAIHVSRRQIATCTIATIGCCYTENIMLLGARVVLLTLSNSKQVFREEWTSPICGYN
jgi:hypothetical protein